MSSAFLAGSRDNMPPTVGSPSFRGTLQSFGFPRFIVESWNDFSRLTIMDAGHSANIKNPHADIKCSVLQRESEVLSANFFTEHAQDRLFVYFERLHENRAEFPHELSQVTFNATGHRANIKYPHTDTECSVFQRESEVLSANFFTKRTRDRLFVDFARLRENRAEFPYELSRVTFNAAGHWANIKNPHADTESNVFQRENEVLSASFFTKRARDQRLRAVERVPQFPQLFRALRCIPWFTSS